MNPVLSIVIPVYRERNSIGPCLDFLQDCEGTDRCEIVVVDGDRGSTQTRAEQPNISVLTSLPGRGHQLNVGAGATTGGAIAFLHVDTRPPRDFVQRIAQAVGEYGAGAFDLRIDSSNLLVRLIGFVGMLRSRLTRVPYGDQVQFIRRDLFQRVGGFPEIPIMEDVALMDRLKRAGERIVLLRPPAVTSGRRWGKEGAIRTTLRNWRLLRAYRAGVDPSILVQSYRPHSERVRKGKLFKVCQRVFEKKALAVFYRALRPTGVKTRLAEEIGQESALAIYRGMLEDTQTWIPRVSAAIVPFVDDPDAGEHFYSGSRPQRGDGLGVRMANAFTELFRNGKVAAAVLIGTDVPGISDAVIVDAFVSLNGNDAVIGPCVDGGYYLIGFTRRGFAKQAFAPLSHSRGASTTGASGLTILDSTLAALHAQGRTVGLLGPLQDVDTLADLRLVCAAARGEHPHLMAAVSRALGDNFVTRQ